MVFHFIQVLFNAFGGETSFTRGLIIQVILDAGPCRPGAAGALYARLHVQEPAGTTGGMMGMRQCIIGRLMAADHVFTMTRAPRGDERDRGEKERRPGVKPRRLRRWEENTRRAYGGCKRRGSKKKKEGQAAKEEEKT